ncbi:Cupin domain-containing protein [Hymenobacter gelipurpurascens]|uniref:Cupin domain-containing protein n=1 Tax=Hymenobacter gelipurpurascens TaxID=89968 RepID=A0A212TQN8_9BACT|nr:cupin domain-containing protein [Hymenobacter gelipurpurascens]SNC68315.1 Cupin domain-containing protein [Hymenobacter gelipurpurascens]
MSVTSTSFRSGSLLAGGHTPLGETKAQVLLEKNGQKVIFKTFRQGEVMPTHDAPMDVLVTVLAGRLIITVDGTPTEVEAGDYVIIPAGAPHALSCREPARILIYR